MGPCATLATASRGCHRPSRPHGRLNVHGTGRHGQHHRSNRSRLTYAHLLLDALSTDASHTGRSASTVSALDASNNAKQPLFEDLVIAPVHLLKWLRESDSAIYEAAIEYADPDAAESDERTLFAISDAQKILVMNTPCGSRMCLVNFARMTSASSFESYVIRYHSAPKRSLHLLR